MQNNKQIIHYDTIQAIKINNNNSFICKFILKEKLLNVKRIYLKSLELANACNNIRLPYSFIRFTTTVDGVITTQILTLPNKSYIDINLFLIDLNILLYTIILKTGESVQFAISTSEINKLVIKATLITSSIIIYNEGLIYYYLGQLTNNFNLLNGTNTLLYCYNLCFDNYYNMNIQNLFLQTSNNNNFACTFKLIVNSITNTIQYTSENNNFVQDVICNHNTNLSELIINITDRYGNSLLNSYDYSFSLGYEF